MTLFGICKFSGGGMQFTKDANPSDGLLDITIVKNLNVFDLIYNIKKLYNGNIVHHKKVAVFKTKKITIIPRNTDTYIQADGELIGTGKVIIKIIDKAIQFIVN
jgi:diacylglycerol kinase family enzyme